MGSSDVQTLAQRTAERSVLALNSPVPPLDPGCEFRRSVEGRIRGGRVAAGRRQLFKVQECSQMMTAVIPVDRSEVCTRC
jgi:hypothetical protein